MIITTISLIFYKSFYKRFYKCLRIVAFYLAKNRYQAALISCLSCLITLSSPALGANHTIVVFGDSVSAAYGMKPEQGWVHLLAAQLKESHPNYQVINASVSGETTGGGLVRLPKTLALHQPDVLILELGGNDGLRGYPINKIEANLNAMIRLTKRNNTKIVLIGMVLPPNYGPRYTRAFEDLYAEISLASDLQFLPFLLEGIATPESLMQADGIHPKPEAQAILLENIWPHIETLLNIKSGLEK